MTIIEQLSNFVRQWKNRGTPTLPDDEDLIGGYDFLWIKTEEVFTLMNHEGELMWTGKDDEFYSDTANALKVHYPNAVEATSEEAFEAEYNRRFDAALARRRA